MPLFKKLLLVGGLLLVSVAGCSLLRLDPTIEVERVASATFSFTSSCGETCCWNFGDGTLGEGKTAEHTYATRGEYTVSLNVYTDDAHSSTWTRVEAGHNWDVPSDLEEAIDRASPGDTLYVSGSYSDIFVDKELDIVGPAEITCMVYYRTEGRLTNVALYGYGDYSEHDDYPALALNESDVWVADCTISGNSVVGYGAGAYVINSAAIFKNCRIESNSATQGGGGVYAVGHSKFPSFESCTISANTTESVGGGILIQAHMGEELAPGAQLPRIEDCLFTANQATGDVAGGAIHVGTNCRALVADCTYSANTPVDVVYEDKP
jgi:predicted outer membrane repeat protein